MPIAEFIEFLKRVQALREACVFDPDDIEMRWINAYDGDTEWHPLTFDRAPFKYGWFPDQAEYRFRESAP